MIPLVINRRHFSLKGKPVFADLSIPKLTLYISQIVLLLCVFFTPVFSSGFFDTSVEAFPQTQSSGATSKPAESKSQHPLGLVPGKTTEAELFTHETWRDYLKDYRDPKGYRYLLYQVKRYSVAITTLDGVVQTVDIFFPAPAPIGVIIAAFGLGNQSELSMPSAALVGVGIPDHWVPKHYAERGAVIFTSVAEGEESMQLLRFYKSAS